MWGNEFREPCARGASLTYAHRSLFSRIAERLSINPCSRLQILALELGVDRHTLLKAVKQETRLSFRAYQRRRCVEFAIALLVQSGELSEKQIAARVGYQSPDAFSRFIRRETGKTPSEIRKRAVFDR